MRPQSDVHQVGSLVTTLTMANLALCPACASSRIERSIDGGLFLDRCEACGWESSGSCSPTIEGLPPSPVNRVSVRWLEGDVPPHALKLLRKVSPLAKKQSIADLMASMAEGRPFELGVVAEYARAQLSRELEQAGFVATSDAVS